MKKILTIVLIFLSSVCYSQIKYIGKDTIPCLVYFQLTDTSEVKIIPAYQVRDIHTYQTIDKFEYIYSLNTYLNKYKKPFIHYKTIWIYQQ